MTKIEVDALLSIPDDWTPRERALMAFAFQAAIEGVRATLDILEAQDLIEVPDELRVALLGTWAQQVSGFLPEGVTARPFG